MITRSVKYMLIGMVVYKSTKYVAKKIQEWKDSRSEEDKA